MDLKEILNEFWVQEEKNAIITDSDGNTMYQSGIMDIPAETVVAMSSEMTADADERELTDVKNDLYINVIKRTVEKNGARYICYRFYDISEYTLLTKDVASYSRFLSGVSKFQAHIMSRLSLPYDSFIPDFADYCMSNGIVVYLRDGDTVTESSYDGKNVIRRTCSSEECDRFLNIPDGDTAEGYLCIANSGVMDKSYVVLIADDDKNIRLNDISLSVRNVIKLFIENSILREAIVYESEHDRLTGLYNKGKYMALKSISFGKPGTIAIYNFDVNNLKYINDTFGHEYGDALIVKAAKSIAAVTSDKVYGFRMGGDEYVMVSVGLTREQAEAVREEWRAALAELNEENDGIFCAMACGMAFGSGDYDYDELYALADKDMYVNKKELKAKNIGSHLTDNGEWNS